MGHYHSSAEEKNYDTFYLNANHEIEFNEEEFADPIIPSSVAKEIKINPNNAINPSKIPDIKPNTKDSPQKSQNIKKEEKPKDLKKIQRAAHCKNVNKALQFVEDFQNFYGESKNTLNLDGGPLLSLDLSFINDQFVTDPRSKGKKNNQYDQFLQQFHFKREAFENSQRKVEFESFTSDPRYIGDAKRSRMAANRSFDSRGSQKLAVSDFKPRFHEHSLELKAPSSGMEKSLRGKFATESRLENQIPPSERSIRKVSEERYAQEEHEEIKPRVNWKETKEESEMTENKVNETQPLSERKPARTPFFEKLASATTTIKSHIEKQKGLLEKNKPQKREAKTPPPELRGNLTTRTNESENQSKNRSVSPFKAKPREIHPYIKDGYKSYWIEAVRPKVVEKKPKEDQRKPFKHESHKIAETQSYLSKTLKPSKYHAKLNTGKNAKPAESNNILSQIEKAEKIPQSQPSVDQSKQKQEQSRVELERQREEQMGRNNIEQSEENEEEELSSIKHDERSSQGSWKDLDQEKPRNNNEKKQKQQSDFNQIREEEDEESYSIQQDRSRWKNSSRQEVQEERKRGPQNQRNEKNTSSRHQNKAYNNDYYDEEEEEEEQEGDEEEEERSDTERSGWNSSRREIEDGRRGPQSQRNDRNDRNTGRNQKQGYDDWEDRRNHERSGYKSSQQEIEEDERRGQMSERYTSRNQSQAYNDEDERWASQSQRNTSKNTSRNQSYYNEEERRGERRKEAGYRRNETFQEEVEEEAEEDYENVPNRYSRRYQDEQSEEENSDNESEPVETNIDLSAYLMNKEGQNMQTNQKNNYPNSQRMNTQYQKEYENQTRQPQQQPKIMIQREVEDGQDEFDEQDFINDIRGKLRDLSEKMENSFSARDFSRVDDEEDSRITSRNDTGKSKDAGGKRFGDFLTPDVGKAVNYNDYIKENPSNFQNLKITSKTISSNSGRNGWK